MRIALFVTCLGDTLFPEVGQATVARARAARARGRLPAEQTCCGQMHLNSGYRDEALALGAALRRVFGELRGRRLAVVVLRRDRARALPTAGDATNVFELSELLVQRLGVEDVGASFPAASPTTRPATRCA